MRRERFIAAGLPADAVDGVIQQIALGGSDLTDAPVITAGIVVGGKLACGIGGVGVDQLAALIYTVDRPGEGAIALGAAGFAVPLGHSDYVGPDSQSAAIEWNTVTRKTFENRLKKWNVTVTKWDGETGSSLSGTTYRTGTSISSRV